MDAFTTKEHTCFYVTVLDEHLPLAADLLADILLHPRFDAGDIEREKGVVLQEFGMVEDTPDDVIHDLFAERIWPQHPLGRPILGDRKIVQGFERDTLLRLLPHGVLPGAHHDRRRRPRPPRATGGSPGEQVPRLPAVRDAAGGRSPRPGDQPRSDRAPARAGPLRAGGPRARAGRPRALRAVPPEHDLRGEHVVPPVPGGAGAGGPVYSIHSGNAAFRDGGHFYVYAGTEPAHFRRVVELTSRSSGRCETTGSPPTSSGGRRTISRGA